MTNLRMPLYYFIGRVSYINYIVSSEWMMQLSHKIYIELYIKYYKWVVFFSKIRQTEQLMVCAHQSVRFIVFCCLKNVTHCLKWSKTLRSTWTFQYYALRNIELCFWCSNKIKMHTSMCTDLYTRSLKINIYFFPFQWTKPGDSQPPTTSQEAAPPPFW